ncbi:GAF domain-containing protein [Streptomyces sp. P38-E01]|uniref:GAF domain-containing protein n=1 Tax=Streptomyces tardus TaxID=2780544 RepID=A0A949NAI0_9ACTN|nr:GAF domain-containing protein [Streptomyces tardus]MBU7600681.1 GAF domain-containing protein [Streptomyces tardus]
MPPKSYDPTSHLLLTPEDSEAPLRVVRLRELGIGGVPVAEFDEFARELARLTGAPWAMVNFIDERRQFFAGLHAPTAPGNEPGTAPGRSIPGRVMARDHGYCPHVIARRRALVLEDVCDYPRFAGNPMVDEIGVRSYLGAPLMDRTGLALGTVCVVAQEPRPWGLQGLQTIKAKAAELVAGILRREQRLP